MDREIADEIRAYISGELLPGGPALAPGDSLLDGRLDSAALMVLLTFIEERFDVAFDDEHLTAASIGTVEAIARQVRIARDEPERRP